MIEYVDSILQQVASAKVPVSRLREVAHRLATQSQDREPVKLGIALLGLLGDPNARDIITTLGRHEEFTLFSAVALSNSLEDAEPALWELARNVEGWGRIHLVKLLAGTDSQEIKDWTRSILAVVVAGVGLARDAQIVALRLPENRRLIPQTVFRTGLIRAALQFGFELGTGVRTYMPATAPYVLAAALVLTASGLSGFVSVALGFAIGRGIMPWVRLGLQSQSAFDDWLRRSERTIIVMAGVTVLLGVAVIVFRPWFA